MVDFCYRRVEDQDFYLKNKKTRRKNLPTKRNLDSQRENRQAKTKLAKSTNDSPNIHQIRILRNKIPFFNMTQENACSSEELHPTA